MKFSVRNSLLLALFTLSLAGCFHVELRGTVAGATVAITELRTNDMVEDALKAMDEEGFVALRSQELWDELDDLARLVNLGNFFVDTSLYEEDTLYLVTVTAGEDMDANGDGKEDDSYTPVEGSWHAIVRGSELQRGGYVISPLTEALYQSVKGELAQLDDAELLERLDSDTALILGDVDRSGEVDYRDALSWSINFHRDLYLLDYANVRKLSRDLIAGADEASVRDRAFRVMGQDGAPDDAQQFFTDNISAPIVQRRCVNCHTQFGSAPAQGARLVLLANNNSNHLQENHQAFIRLGTQLGSRDLSDYVTGKASGRISHGGGMQLQPGSDDLRNLETYLNLLE